MRYSIVIATRAKKEIDKLPPKIKQKIASALEELSTNPFLGKALKADLKGLYSYRVGSYRVIYNILRHQLIIQIIKIMHRKNAYR